MRKPSILLLLGALAFAAAAQAPPAQQAPRLEPAPPIVVPTDPQEARCQRLLREYAVSAACYARFRTVTGVKREAFDRCGPPVPDPRGTECPIRP